MNILRFILTKRFSKREEPTPPSVIRNVDVFMKENMAMVERVRDLSLADLMQRAALSEKGIATWALDPVRSSLLVHYPSHAADERIGPREIVEIGNRVNLLIRKKVDEMGCRYGLSRHDRTQLIVEVPQIALEAFRKVENEVPDFESA